eukprot:1145033-Pelagomonas_calceolata.AAC.10
MQICPLKHFKPAPNCTQNQPQHKIHTSPWVQSSAPEQVPHHLACVHASSAPLCLICALSVHNLYLCASSVPCLCHVCALSVPPLCHCASSVLRLCHVCALSVPPLCLCASSVQCLCLFCASSVPCLCLVCASSVPCLCLVCASSVPCPCLACASLPRLCLCALSVPLCPTAQYRVCPKPTKVVLLGIG